MKSLREIKREARRDLHKHMRVPALYLIPISGAPSSYEDPIPVNVRIHTKFDTVGDIKGTNFHYAEREDTQPRIIFMRDQIDQPLRGAIISVGPGEAYRVDHAMPPDDITVTAKCVALLAEKTVGLPLPEGFAPDGSSGGFYTDDNVIGSYQTEDE